MQTILSLLGLSRSPLVGATPEAPVQPPAPDVPAPAPALKVLPANEPFEVRRLVARVTATALWDAFDANEAAAERRFAHQPLYVSGAVERVARDGPVYVVKLSVSGAWFDSVRCRVGDVNRFNVGQLRRGDLAMVLGQRVFRQHGHVIVDDCLVIEDDLTVLPLRRVQ